MCGVVMSSRLLVRMRRVEFGGDVGIATRHCHSGVANKGIVSAVQLVDAVTGDGWHWEGGGGI